MPKINPAYQEALYRQIAEDLAAKIRTGEILPGERLPTELQICEIYSVSRITARQAVTKLEGEGLVLRQQGKGTFVQRAKLRQDVRSTHGFLVNFLRQSSNGSVQTLSFQSERAPELIRSKMSCMGEENLPLLRRTYSVGSRVIAYGEEWLAPEFAKVSAETAMSHSTQDMFAMVDLEIADVDLIIRSEGATSEIANYLGIKAGAPVLVAYRDSQVAGGRIKGCARISFSSDDYEFSFSTNDRMEEKQIQREVKLYGIRRSA